MKLVHVILVLSICLPGCGKTKPPRPTATFPIKTTVTAFDDALYLSTQFFAIGEDHYLFSDATNVSVQIELTPLDKSVSAETLLAKLLSAKRLARLSKPKAEFRQSGVFLDTPQRKLLIINGGDVIKDGCDQIARCLAGAPTCRFITTMKFERSGLYDDSPPPAELKITGSVSGDEIKIESSGGLCDSVNAIDELLQAATLFGTLENSVPKSPLKAIDEDEANAFQSVADDNDLESRVDGTSISLPGREDDAIILLAYVRHGKEAFGF